MNRYRLVDGVETQFQPGSHRRVLVNWLGITKKREMDQAEYDALVRVQEHYLQIITPDTNFTVALLCQMHLGWLGGIYEWAGQYRTVDLAKEGFRWPPAYLVDSNMLHFENEILAKYTPCRPDELSEVA